MLAKTVSPAFVSQKILKCDKPRHQQCLVYKFECDLCDAGYVGYTSRHLHQRIEEDKSAISSIGQHFQKTFRLFPCSLVPLVPCYPVPLLPCYPVTLFPCSLVPLFPCCLVILFSCSLFLYFLSLFPCFPVPLFPCSSLFPFSSVFLFPVPLFP